MVTKYRWEIRKEYDRKKKTVSTFNSSLDRNIPSNLDHSRSSDAETAPLSETQSTDNETSTNNNHSVPNPPSHPVSETVTNYPTPAPHYNLRSRSRAASTRIPTLTPNHPAPIPTRTSREPLQPMLNVENQNPSHQAHNSPYTPLASTNYNLDPTHSRDNSSNNKIGGEERPYPFEIGSKEFDFRKLRPTDLPFNKQIYMPGESEIEEIVEEEVHVAYLSRELDRITKEYDAKSKNVKSNLTKKEKEG